MLAKITVSHSQKAIVNVYHAGSWPPPSGLPPKAWISHVPVVITAPTSTTNITGLRTCTRGSSFLRLSISACTMISRWNSDTAWRSWVTTPSVIVNPRLPFHTRTVVSYARRDADIRSSYCGRGRG